MDSADLWRPWRRLFLVYLLEWILDFLGFEKVRDWLPSLEMSGKSRFLQ